MGRSPPGGYISPPLTNTRIHRLTTGCCMALLKASAAPSSPTLWRGLFFRDAYFCGTRGRAAAERVRSGSVGGARWVSFRNARGSGRGGRRGGLGEAPGRLRCSTSAGQVGRVGEASEGDGGKWGVSGGQGQYLVREFGWGVRKMANVGEEMRSVAHIQAEAFHVPVALFDDFFFQFFEAEVLSALIYRLRNSAPDRYACLVAEHIDASNFLCTSLQGLVGVVDASIQREENVLRHLDRAEEYLYVSGIAVLKSYRRRKVASALLKACDALSELWGCTYLVLHAYEDDLAARELYSKAGYKAISGDPWWMNTWFQRRPRVLMIKRSSQCKYS